MYNVNGFHCFHVAHLKNTSHYTQLSFWFINDLLLSVAANNSKLQFDIFLRFLFHFFLSFFCWGPHIWLCEIQPPHHTCEQQQQKTRHKLCIQKVSRMEPIFINEINFKCKICGVVFAHLPVFLLFCFFFSFFLLLSLQLDHCIWLLFLFVNWHLHRPTILMEWFKRRPRRRAYDCVSTCNLHLCCFFISSWHIFVDDDNDDASDFFHRATGARVFNIYEPIDTECWMLKLQNKSTD